MSQAKNQCNCPPLTTSKACVSSDICLSSAVDTWSRPKCSIIRLWLTVLWLKDGTNQPSPMTILLLPFCNWNKTTKSNEGTIVKSELQVKSINGFSLRLGNDLFPSWELLIPCMVFWKTFLWFVHGIILRVGSLKSELSHLKTYTYNLVTQLKTNRVGTISSSLQIWCASINPICIYLHINHWYETWTKHGLKMLITCVTWDLHPFSVNCPKI